MPPPASCQLYFLKKQAVGNKITMKLLGKNNRYTLRRKNCIFFLLIMQYMEIPDLINRKFYPNSQTYITFIQLIVSPPFEEKTKIRSQAHIQEVSTMPGIHTCIYSFIPPFIQHMFIEYLPFIKCIIMRI